MKNIDGNSRLLPWLTAGILSILVTACGGGGGGQSPILGAGNTAPVVPPVVTVVTPLPNASLVAINTKFITAAFSKAMDSTTLTPASFTLVCPAYTSVTGGAVSYVAASKTAKLTLSTALPSNVLCSATVTTAAKDSAGIAMLSNFVWQFTTSAVADTTPPTVTRTINANNAVGVAVNTRVGATFSEAMDPATITGTSLTLKQTVSGAAVVGTVSYSSVDAVFVPASSLLTNTNYTATVNNTVTDLAGNIMLSNYVWSWTTALAADTTAPRVIGTIHANGATNVPINTRVGATFSEAMNPLTITNANFTLKQTLSGVAVVGTTSYSGVDAVFIPVSNLLAGTQYTVTVKGGVTGVEDLSANPMAADYSLKWTTAAADTTAPLVALRSPLAGATNVPMNSAVNATFNEAMDPLTINNANFTLADNLGGAVAGTVNFNALNKIATFTPSASLVAGITYTATVTNGVADLAGNAMLLSDVWTFTTANVLSPVITLNTVAPYGTFGGTAGMTNTGTLSLVNGDIGTIATSTGSITGFHDTSGDIYTETPANIGPVNGKIYTCTNSTTGPTSASPNAPACAIATQARLDAQIAYLALVALPVGGASPAPGANLAGVTLLPGTYVAPGGSSFMIQGGNLTLDAQGNANAVWVFQMATTLTVGGPGAAAPQNIILANGALPKNVFWQVGSFATINAGGGGTMVGTIISQEGASFSTVGNVNIVTLEGRVLSLGASVTLVDTVINVPAP